jgi:DNA repair protein RadC
MTYQIVSERKLRREVKIGNPDEVYALLKRYAGARQEHFILVTLNGANNVISVSIISIGLVNKAVIHPREVFCKAVSDRATGIIICHNHPSGVLDPSKEDMLATEELFKAGEIVGIPLVDHIIFSKTGYSSLKKLGVFPKG